MFVKERFKLSPYAISLINDLEPDFGYDGFGEFIFYRTYSRWNGEKQESWHDCVIRVIEGCMSIRKDWYIKNHISWVEKFWQEYALKMAISLFKMEWLAPGRGLWAMGTDFIYERGSMALNNCFSGETKYLTDKGMRTFASSVNEEVTVLCSNNQWNKAQIKCFGKQKLNLITFKSPKSKFRLQYFATPHHNWILADQSRTSRLQPGDKVKISPSFFGNVNEEDQLNGYVHGLVFADGTKDPYSPGKFKLRLCNKKNSEYNIITQSKYYTKSSEPESYNGDKYCVFHTLEDLKDLPLEGKSLSYKSGFLEGWIKFDAHIHTDDEYGLDSTNSSAVDWLIDYAPILGYTIKGHSIDNEDTNYGKRNFPLHRLALNVKPHIYSVEHIMFTGREEDVYCVIEPLTHSFTLAGGIVTGNCGVTELGEDFENDLGWLMDALMLGVGVGFSPTRNDKLRFSPRHEGTYDFEIPDSREGWVESVVRLISAMRYGTKRPRMIYDKVRPAGLLIRGFGGISSGPQPLMYLHEKIEELCILYMDDPYYDSVMLKMDIANLIGCCVVAGNVRRSAELASLSIKDPVFKNLKNYEDPRYAYRAEWGWMSNNATDLEDDTDFEHLGEIAESVKIRGEPGYKNLQNFPYGRIGKSVPVRLDKGRYLNPCCSGDTFICLADGRGFVSIKNLEGTDADVYCINEKGEAAIRKGRNFRKTGFNQKILRVVLDDGSYIRVTENHEFMLKDRTYKSAKDLRQGNQLARFNRYVPINCIGESYFDKYISVSYGARFHQAEHRLIAARNLGPFCDDEHIHHKDENKLNNDPKNLEIKDSFEHLSNHSIGSSNPNWSGYTNQEVLDFGISLAKKLGRRFSVGEWKEFGPVELRFAGEYRKGLFGSFLDFAQYCAEAAEVVCDQLDPRTLRFYLEMIALGYESEIIGEDVYVTKTCPSCKNPFSIKAVTREQTYCSFTCTNLGRDYSKNREGQAKAFEKRRETLRQQQADMYTQIKTRLGRHPTLREWKAECKDYQVSPEICRIGSPFRSMSDLAYYAREHNHRILSVYEDGYEDVYNVTVDEYNNYIIGGWCHINEFGREVQSGVVTPNCGESILENKELCNQSETLPTRCDSPETWLKACEYATTFSSTISLLPTHQPETNKVIARNRRITVSIIDYTGWKLEHGVNKVTKWMRVGYDTVTKTNQWANSEAGVPEAIRKTTIKPGGTTPKLAGRTPGIGHPTFTHTLRRVIIAKNSPLVPLLQEANIPLEQKVNDPGSLIVQWPIIQGPAKPAYEISLWEQAMNLVLVQREWADNAVSNTLYFRPKWVLIGLYQDTKTLTDFLSEKVDLYKVLAKIDSENEDFQVDKYRIKTDFDQESGAIVEISLYVFDRNHEEDSIEPVLSAIAPLTKSVSLLPHSPKGVYEQMPEEGISEQEYWIRKQSMRKIDWFKLTGSTGEDERYCQGANCEVVPK